MQKPTQYFKAVILQLKLGASLVAQTIKNLPAMLETWVWSLAQKEKPVATHSSILAWRIPWTEEPVDSGVTELDMIEHQHPPIKNK